MERGVAVVSPIQVKLLQDEACRKASRFTVGHGVSSVTRRTIKMVPR